MTMTTTGRIPDWTVADRLRKARESAGYEQAALARELGVAKNTISNYERGAVTPRRSVVMAWAMATGVDLDWLCPRQDSNLQPTDLWALARRRRLDKASTLCAGVADRIVRTARSRRRPAWVDPTDLRSESWVLAA
jgi:transcriptional regulator with XRE-family HTH domain